MARRLASSSVNFKAILPPFPSDGAGPEPPDGYYREYNGKAHQCQHLGDCGTEIGAEKHELVEPGVCLGMRAYFSKVL